jgi:hypothetical protein
MKEMRVEKLWPGTNWNRVWKNLWAAPVPDDIKNSWYHVIHDILPTNERLHNIRIAQTDLCSICNHKDTLQYRMIECGEGRDQWKWTRGRLAIILRTDTCWLPDDWLYRPQFQIWPPQRHRAVLWILAHFVAFQTQTKGDADDN